VTGDVRDHLEVALRALPSGWQIAIHAIGDRANRLGLDLLEDALRRTGADADAVRPRLEHAQVLAAGDIPRFARLGVIASMQPTHCTSDMDWADERLGPDRLAGAYAWRSLLRSGARLAFGSDFPVERPDPLEGIYAAATRQHPDGTPEGGFRPEQRLTVEEALRAFTEGAAWAAFEEGRLGRLAPGFAADLVVLDRNPTRLQEITELLEARVLLTVAGGEVVFEAGSL
jgi:predicted amidohydrolase YtcJ